MTTRQTRGDRNSALAEHVQARQLGKQTIANAIEIGRRLIECKNIVGPGNFGNWLDTEFGWGEPAQNLMRVYELSKSESANFADLSLPVSSLYLLAAPSTPEPARAEILTRVKAGERLQHKEVKQVVVTHSKVRFVSSPPVVTHSKTRVVSSPPVVTRSIAVEVVTPEPVVEEKKVVIGYEVTPALEQARLAAVENTVRMQAIRIGGLENENEELKTRPPTAALTLEAAIGHLIERANTSINFENLLPETVVYAAKDLDEVVRKLRALNEFLAKRRTAAKKAAAKLPPAIVPPPADDPYFIPADLDRTQQQATKEQWEEGFSDLARLGGRGKPH